MHKLLRFYSQNRLKVWATILGIIFILVIIQVLNSISRNQIEEQNRNILEEETTLSNVVSYDSQSESILSDEDVPEQYRKDFGNLIEQFFNYCTNHEPRKAYNFKKQLMYYIQQRKYLKVLTVQKSFQAIKISLFNLT